MLRLFNTVKYLSIYQIFSRLLKHPKKLVSIFFLKKKIIDIKTTKIKSEFFIQYYNSDFDKEIFKDYKKKRNRIWSTKKNSLYLYNLHYLNLILLLPKKISFKLILDWLTLNKISYNSIAWDPYPTSLRLINLIKWCLKNNFKSKVLLYSIKLHTKYLEKNLEHHLGGNHLISNYKALIFSYYFLERDFSNRKREKMYQIFLKELNLQVLKDGGHFEQSPMYHNQFVYDLLDILQITKKYKKNNKISISIIKKMLKWSKIMSLKGEPAFFNDTCNRIQPNFMNLYNYAKKLKIDFHKNFFKEKKFVFLQDSGFLVFKSSAYKIIFRCGGVKANNIPAHQHANLFSFEVANKNEKIFTNSGVSTYDDNYSRYKDRSTMSQNTLSINKKNNIDIWKSFRVGKRPKVRSRKIRSNKSMTFENSHNGFETIFNKLIHKRIISFANNYFSIEDEVKGKGKHNIYINFILANNFKLKKLGKSIYFKKGKYEFASILSSDDVNIKINKTKINENYFRKKLSKKIIIYKNSSLPYRSTFKINFI